LVVGLLAGHSREPAIAAVVPAVLTLIGAIIGFVYSGAALTRERKPAVLLASVAMVIFLFWGALAGARLREPWDRYHLDFEVYKHKLEMQRMGYQKELEMQKLQYHADIERETMRYKVDLDIYRERAIRHQR